MGEHHLDLSIDEILEQEAHRVAEKIAEREAATIRWVQYPFFSLCGNVF